VVVASGSGPPVVEGTMNLLTGNKIEASFGGIDGSKTKSKGAYYDLGGWPRLRDSSADASAL